MLATILIAYTLDLIIGDPQWKWHPVRIIGRLIQKLEKGLNKEGVNKIFGGLILVIIVVGATGFCVWSILKAARLAHPVLYFIASVALIYFVLSIKSLGVEAMKVQRALKKGDIIEARQNLSMIVGRDTDKLTEPEIIRATVETVAESIMDGIIAPLFYLFLGGPVLAWVYKAINTLDSMVGYRSERFIEFGKASAKLDGLVNLLPAKLTCLCIFISSVCRKKNWRNCFKWLMRYLFKGPYDNSEATEAAMAGALGVRLGGVNFYKSVPIEKRPLGDNIQSLNVRHIKEASLMAYVSSALFVGCGIIL